MREGWIWDNPVQRANRVTVPRREMRPPTATEFRRLAKFIEERDYVFHLFVSLAASTGARRAQMLALRWHNIATDYRSVSFTAGWVEGPNGPVLVPTKANRAHSVEIDAVTGRRLAQHAQRCRRSDDGFLFGDESGEVAWQPNRVTKTFGRHVRAADLRRVRLHDRRHFMATQMLNRKIPIVVVSRRLDHARVSTTLDIYTHAMPGSDADAADMMADVMYGSDPTSDISRPAVRVRRVSGRLSIRRPGRAGPVAT